MKLAFTSVHRPNRRSLHARRRASLVGGKDRYERQRARSAVARYSRRSGQVQTVRRPSHSPMACRAPGPGGGPPVVCAARHRRSRRRRHRRARVYATTALSSSRIPTPMVSSSSPPTRFGTKLGPVTLAPDTQYAAVGRQLLVQGAEGCGGLPRRAPRGLQRRGRCIGRTTSRGDTTAVQQQEQPSLRRAALASCPARTCAR